ncbi:accessory factor UbiK family protein [Halomonas sp. I5-271120]|uniref:accessory factor UbiK family protein n=1 Tax=Halomonas sp. I5-271120 TaxID=3061632 RepID=UPI002714D82F|nr:accessory factor UbiK family protein [Halomonas sp. I5-271120]
MVTNDRISRLAQQLGERLQGASHAPEELQRSVQQVVRSAFDRMELVTREDFDILMDVLQRTRSRVESLEKQVAALEAAIERDTSASTKTPLAAEAAEVAPEALDESPADEATPSDDKAAKSSADKKAPGQH